MSDEDVVVPFDDDVYKNPIENRIDVLEDHEDSDDDDNEPFGFLHDKYVTGSLAGSIGAWAYIQPDGEERVTRSAIEQIRVNKRLSGDQTLRRLLMKACQLGYKGVLDKLLELRVYRTTGDFGNEVS